MDSEVYSEVYSILKTLGKEYIDLIPIDIQNTIKNNMDNNYQPNFTLDNIKKDNLKSDTIEIIEMFYNKYWMILLMNYNQIILVLLVPRKYLVYIAVI